MSMSLKRESVLPFFAAVVLAAWPPLMALGQVPNRIVAVDGSTYSTLSAALSACSWPSCVIDARGNGSKSVINIDSTLTLQVPTIIYLGCFAYIGPANGPLLQISKYAANGSAVIGCGMTSNNQPNGGNGTRLQARAANTSDVVVLAAQSGAIHGVRLENLTIDGASAAVHALTMDSVRNSIFSNLSFENTTGPAINAVVTNPAQDQGNQFNLFLHIRSNNVGGLLLATGTNLSDFTHNTLIDIQGNVNQAAAPGIELRDADTNHFYDVSFVNSSGGQKCVQEKGKTFPSLQLDAGNSKHIGAQNNYFYGVHLDNWCPMWIQGTESDTNPSTGNQFYGYDRIELQKVPTLGRGALALIIDSKGTIETPGGVVLTNIGATGKALCSKADKSIGSCSGAIASDGSCACN